MARISVERLDLDRHDRLVMTTASGVCCTSHLECSPGTRTALVRRWIAGSCSSGARVFAFPKNVMDSWAAVLIDPGATPADDSAIIVRPRRVGIGLTVGVGR